MEYDALVYTPVHYLNIQLTFSKLLHNPQALFKPSNIICTSPELCAEMYNSDEVCRTLIIQNVNLVTDEESLLLLCLKLPCDLIDDCIDCEGTLKV